MPQVITGSDLLAALPSLSDQNLDALATTIDSLMRVGLRRRVLAQEACTDTLWTDARFRDDSIWLSEYPIVSVQSITVNDVNESTSNFWVEKLRLKKKTGQLPLKARIVIAYTAGYADGSYERTTLKSGAIAIAKLLNRELADVSAGDGVVTEEKLGEWETKATVYASQQGNNRVWPDAIERMLRQFRRGPTIL